jgi:hypothetical protein
MEYHYYQRSQDSVVGIVTGYGLDACGVKNFLHIGQTDSGVHLTYPMGTTGSFPGVKRPGREPDHSPPASAEVKKMWIYMTTPSYAFMV